MEFTRILKNQKGCFSIVLIAIATIISSSSINAAENILTPNAAHHVATSGLQIAKQDILEFGRACGTINNDPMYTYATLPGVLGEYTIRCSVNRFNGFLLNNISSTATTIPLQNIINASAYLASSLSAAESSTIVLTNLEEAEQFTASGGMIKIDDEYIFYGERDGVFLKNLVRGLEDSAAASHGAGAAVYQGVLKSGVIHIGPESISYENVIGNNLVGVIRGVFGTTNTSHSLDSVISQNQLTLLADGAVPDFDDPTEKCTVGETLHINSEQVHSDGISDFNDNCLTTLVVVPVPALNYVGLLVLLVLLSMFATSIGRYWGQSKGTE